MLVVFISSLFDKYIYFYQWLKFIKMTQFVLLLKLQQLYAFKYITTTNNVYY